MKNDGGDVTRLILLCLLFATGLQAPLDLDMGGILASCPNRHMLVFLEGYVQCPFAFVTEADQFCNRLQNDRKFLFQQGVTSWPALLWTEEEIQGFTWLAALAGSVRVVRSMPEDCFQIIGSFLHINYQGKRRRVMTNTLHQLAAFGFCWFPGDRAGARQMRSAQRAMRLIRKIQRDGFDGEPVRSLVMPLNLLGQDSGLLNRLLSGVQDIKGTCGASRESRLISRDHLNLLMTVSDTGFQAGMRIPVLERQFLKIFLYAFRIDAQPIWGDISIDQVLLPGGVKKFFFCML